jgi:hypothetical protein
VLELPLADFLAWEAHAYRIAETLHRPAAE